MIPLGSITTIQLPFTTIKSCLPQQPNYLWN